MEDESAVGTVDLLADELALGGGHEPGVGEDDLEMLEALFAAAVNDAVRKIEANSQDKMSGVTAGMQLPPGMKLPF